MAGVNWSSRIPSWARVTLPSLMIRSARLAAMSIGIAKPTPEFDRLEVAMAELIPITLPSRSTSGPPELPGLIAASVWRKSS